MKYALIVALLFLSSGCGKRTLKIDYEGTWSATVGWESVWGIGDRELEIERGACTTVQKMAGDDTKYLRVELHGAGVAGGLIEKGKTKAPYGLVTVCGD